jgi:hypothetical protein
MIKALPKMQYKAGEQDLACRIKRQMIKVDSVISG